MTVMPGLTCKYDAWNRLVEVRDSSNTLLASYIYNGLNQRVRKTVNNVVTTSFFNSQWQELESSGPQTGVCVYIWGLRYIDDLVLRERGSEKLYALQDSNWNVVATTNASGTVQERMKYDAFGKVTWLDSVFAAKANSDYAWNRTFTGQVLDAETGLMLYRNRYYHTGLGRFVTRDPIGYDGEDENLYRYVKNRSIVSYDSFGLQSAYYGNYEETFNTIAESNRQESCKKFKKWLEKELEDTTWHEGLPDCPCSLDFRPGTGRLWGRYPDNAFYTDKRSPGSVKDKWRIESRNRHWFFHPGSHFCIKSLSSGTSNDKKANSQCCYCGRHLKSAARGI